ncbi:hypothetical protein EXIGLDRAFT_734031 [Exidia glandulosa HHB12029]|uniref:Uncharacterized protein n=1 Tax=Exidia glandulosa HHB12029 TaxID=1314781 RepID=A0A165B5Z7_EXIGL|nr:hypothetical protein EXIGLDRAFT_734031 [Exidia glandulosa HHB12029]
MTPTVSEHVSAASLEVLREAKIAARPPHYRDFRERHWGKRGAATVRVPRLLDPLVFLPYAHELDPNLGDSRIVVRSVYRQLWNHIYGKYIAAAARPDERSCKATIVWGHPGIGKSVSLIYLMVAAAELQLPFVYYRTGLPYAYVCLDVGDFLIKPEMLSFLEHTVPTLILVDSSPVMDTPQYVYDTRNTHVVLASSPATGRHSVLAKYRQGTYYTLDLVPENEFRAMIYLREERSTPFDEVSAFWTGIRVQTDDAAGDDDTDADDLDDAPVPTDIGGDLFWKRMDVYRLLGPNVRTAFFDFKWSSGDPYEDLLNTADPRNVEDYISILQVVASPGSGHVFGGHARASGFHKLFYELPKPGEPHTNGPPNLHTVPTAFLRHVVLRLVYQLQKAEQLKFLDAVLGRGNLHGTIFEGAILSYLRTTAVTAVLPPLPATSTSSSTATSTPLTIIITPQSDPLSPSFIVYLDDTPALPKISVLPHERAFCDLSADCPTQPGFYVFKKGFASGDALILADSIGPLPVRYEIIVRVTVAEKHDVKVSGIKNVTKALDRYKHPHRTRLFLWVTDTELKGKKLASRKHKALDGWQVGYVVVTPQDLYRISKIPS